MNMKANKIKILFIRWLLKKFPDSIIGNEVLFSINQYRTDILQIQSNKTHAFEIKSDRDNLANIEIQLKNYLETFDYTNLIVTEKYDLGKIQNIDNRVGIFVVTKLGKFKKIRNAKLSRSIKTKNILPFLHRKELINLLSKKGLSKKSTYELRELVEQNVPFKIVKQKSIETLNKRYSKLLELFIYDTNGQNITIDDLTSLTGNLQSNEIN